MSSKCHMPSVSARQIADLIVNRQRELDRVMRADLRGLSDKLVMQACAIADRELAQPAPHQTRPAHLREKRGVAEPESIQGGTHPPTRRARRYRP